MKAKLIRQYPLKKAILTLGKEYEILSSEIVEKQITQRVSLPIKLLSILNDNKKEVLVNELYFEIV